MKPLIAALLALFVLLSWSGVEAQSQKQLQQMQLRQRQAEAARNRALAEQRKQENNIRSLCLILNDEENRKKLKTTEKQNKKLDELDKKYDEIREETINPEGKKLVGPERQEAVKSKQEDLRNLSLQCGRAVMEILTRDQVNAYGRSVDHDRAKRAWEKRMGIEPEKPVKKKDEKNDD